MHWLMSANSNIYDHASSFEHYGFIDWRQGKNKFFVGDTVYIYCTSPAKKIRYKCQVERLNLDFEDIRDDREYWTDETEYKKSIDGKFFRLRLTDQVDSPKLSLISLQDHGLKAAPQSPIKLTGELLNFIDAQFANAGSDDFFPETISSASDIYEGIKQQIIVNKYERSSIARARCLEAHGHTCKICNFDFETTYGKVGEGFIHVHHLKPLHTIGQSYKINYETDLIPVCPNCHAMLHRKAGDNELSVDELKNLVQKNNPPASTAG